MANLRVMNNRVRLRNGKAAQMGPLSGQAATSLTLTDVMDQKVFQRVGTSKAITISGTCGGTPSAIQARIIAYSGGATVVDWQTIATNPVSTYSGSLTVPQGGWYLLQVRDSVNTSLVANGANRFGVGAIVGMIGQSNMANMPATTYQYPLGDPLAVEYYSSAFVRVGNINSGAYYPPNTISAVYGSNYTPGVNKGDGHVFFANLLSEGLGVPVCVLNAAIGGTSITTWQANGTSWTNGGSGAKRFKELMQDLGSDFELCIWYQGESDAATMSGATWQAYLANVQANCKALNGRTDATFKFGVVSLGFGYYNGSVEGDFGKMRVAQIAYTNSQPGSFLVSCNYDAYSDSDTVHLNGISFNRKSRIYVKNTLYAAYGIGTSGVGPKVTGATRSGNVITVNIAQSSGTTLTDGNGGTGAALTTFRVFDGGTQVTIASTAIISATQVQLTLSSTPVSTVTMDNAYMNCPSGTSPNNFNPATTVYDNSLSYGSTVGSPLQPCAAFTVS